MELTSHLQAIEDLLDCAEEGVVFLPKVRDLGPNLLGEVDEFVSIMFLDICVSLVELRQAFESGLLQVINEVVKLDCPFKSFCKSSFDHEDLKLI